MKRGGLVRELQRQVLDLGKLELKVDTLVTTNSGPSYTAYAKLGCPTVAESLTKYGALVAYCTQGIPPSLFQLTSTELRAVSSLSAVEGP